MSHRFSAQLRRIAALARNDGSAGLMNYYTPMGEKGKVWFLCKLPGFRTTGGNT
jgi:hypothetical protein